MDFSKVKYPGTMFVFLHGLLKSGDGHGGGLEPILTTKIMNTVEEHLGNNHRVLSERYNPSQIHQIMARLNEYSYSYVENPFFKHSRHMNHATGYAEQTCMSVNGYKNWGESNDNQAARLLPCKPKHDISEICSEYCNRTMYLSPEKEDFLVKLFEMTIGFVNGKLMLDTPRNMG